MNRIHLVSTGGTIGSAFRDGVLDVDSDGPPAILEFLPEGLDATWSRPFSILSENATSTHWSRLARHIATLPLGELDAVLVSHGSDTLAWTAAALSFTMQGIPVPVVLFGADRPLEDPASNGPDNFRSAIAFSLSERLPGLFVSWKNPGGASDIHLATRLLPADTHRDLFRSPLDAPLGTMIGHVFSRIPHCGNPSRSALVAKADPAVWAQSLRSMDDPVQFEDRVLVLADQPGTDHTPLMDNIGEWKAVIQVAHHCGTASSVEGPGSFLRLARAARDAGVPVFLGPAKSSPAYASLAPLLDAGVRIAGHQTLTSLVVKIRHLVHRGWLDRLKEDLAWELL